MRQASIFFSLSFLALVSSFAPVMADPVPTSWTDARKQATARWLGNGTLYCGCQWRSNGKGGGRIAGDCGWRSSRYSNRASRIEWEHIVPASWLAGHMQCWQSPESVTGCSGLSGRKCCERHAPEARRRIFDIDNLAPTIGAANAERSAEAYGLITGENRAFGSCDFESDRYLTEPRPASRPYIASVVLTMMQRYPDIQWPARYQALMEGWLQ